MSGTYLKHIKIDAFGAFSGKTVGPFGPGLNVVFGRNEAGKTTVASFVGGVLFGWREARGQVNTYRPSNAERSGSLFFATPEGGECELFRTRNADGLQGATSLVADLDKETFQTMFLLTSDELRSLRNTTDVTARLLTAGAGTSASPAHALAEVEARLALYTSRAAAADCSLVRLAEEQDDLRARLAEATDEVERYRREDKEFRDIGPARDDMKRRLVELNTEIESLTALRAQVEKVDAEIAELEEGLAALDDEDADLRESESLPDDEELAALVALTAAEERALRDRLDALAAEEAKCEHAVDLAQDNYASTVASYEALLEAQDRHEQPAYRRTQRITQVVLAIALPLVFIVAGVLMFLAGFDADRLSFTVLGLFLTVFAIVLASASVAMLMRPDKAADAQEERRADAEWVMLQDKKKLEACLAARDDFRVRLREQLDELGLCAAQGSLRQARELLDAAREARAAANLLAQRRQALTSRRAKLAGNLAKARVQRDELFASAPVHRDSTAAEIDAVLAQKSQQREGLLEASEGLNRRYGELKQELSQAERRRDFDDLKQRYQQLLTREEESCREYATLLLAKHMLESAIAAWESKSQPEVYRQASRLLSLMTGGRWTKVEMTEGGQVRVVDEVKTACDPLRLSLGTCQQLYLALRIALLMEADNVGHAVPILADDILVNFDAARRVGAAQALAELACVRQVIMFTCHEEVVEALRAADPGVVELAL